MLDIRNTINNFANHIYNILSFSTENQIENMQYAIAILGAKKSIDYMNDRDYEYDQVRHIENILTHMITNNKNIVIENSVHEYSSNNYMSMEYGSGYMLAENDTLMRLQ